jgi:hypothetical protein
MKNLYLVLVLLFAFGVAQGQLPDGAILHLKADAGVITSGDKITEWQDLTNPGIKAFQTDGNLQPVFVQDAINGMPTIRYSGTQYMQASSVYPVQSDYSLIFLVNLASNDYYNCMITGYGHAIYYNPPRIFHSDGNNVAISSKGLMINKPAIISIVYRDSNQTAEFYIDGVLTAETYIASNYDASIFFGAYLGAYNLCGDLSEIILYERALDQDEKKSAESYLFDKYSLERPTDGTPDKTFTSIPMNNQLYPRDKDDYANVKIAGNFTEEKFGTISVKIFKNKSYIETIAQKLNFVYGSAPFELNYKIHSELSNYKFVISAKNSSRDSVMKVRDNIVAGDVILLDGQSNTQVNNNPYTNQFVRTYGGNASAVPGDTLWSMADDWTQGWTNVGAWGMTLGILIVENQKVPVCVINGAVGGTKIESHLPLAGDRYNLSSIYGSLLYRVEKANLKAAAKALFWYQGESNGVWNYENNFVTLTNEWLKDYPNLQKIYTVQIHTGCGGGYTHSQLREVERRMPEIIKNVKVETIASSGLPGHDGCHYEFIGYQTLGEQLYKQYNRDFFGSKDTVAISSPNISEAFFTDAKKDRIAMVFKPKLTIMRAQADTIVSDISASLRDYIYLSDNSKIMSIQCVDDTVFLNLDRRSKALTITYVPELYYKDTYVIYQGPWLFNQRNMGALTFDQFPVTEKKAITLENHTKELISCIGSDGNFIVCAASATGGVEVQYQWYKDGLELLGETNPKLSLTNFDYPVSGLYKCKVFAAGVAKDVWSGEIPVYALSLPEITDQPKEVINAQIDGTYSFEVKAHYRGKTPPYMKDSFQWYKLEAGSNQPLALVDNGKFGGTTSSILTINGLSADDICQKGEYYIVEIVSQCGSVRSNPFIISQKPEVVFSQHPTDTKVCPNTEVVLEVNAIAPQGYNVTYFWKKDNAPITDNSKFNGTNTAKLQILNAGLADAGYYKCVAEIASEGISIECVPAQLTIKEVPEGNQLNGIIDYTIKRGNDVAFNVELISGAEPLTVKWIFNSEVIKEGVWDKFNGVQLLTLLLESANENQAGDYICSLENECAKIEVKFSLTVTKWDEAGIADVITENGYSLFTAIPNPTNEITTVKYILPKLEIVKFTLSDMSGRVIRNLFEGYAAEGMNQLQINVKQLGLPKGVYFYTMTSDNFSGVRSFVVE